MSESKPIDSSEQVISAGYAVSRRNCSTPSLDLQRSCPPGRHVLAGGPTNAKARTDLYHEIGWLARTIQALEGPSSLQPSEALDRLLGRVTGQGFGTWDAEYVLSELKKLCRATSVHRLEIGEVDLAAKFEEIAVRCDARRVQYFGQPAQVSPPLPSDDSATRSRNRSEWLNQKLEGRGWKFITEHPDGPSDTTMRRYRSGRVSIQDGSVRGQLARVFGCQFSEVPL
jgi:hypothetical protein